LEVASDPTQPPSPGVIDVAVNPTTTAGSISSQGQGNGAPGPTPSPAAPSAPRPRNWLIQFGILATGVLCVMTIALLYLQWWRNDTHNTIIAVWGDESWEGATAQVVDPATQLKLEHPLTKAEEMLARFHVPPGNYDVRIIKDRKVIAQRRRDLMDPLRPNAVWWPFRAPPGAAELGMTR
jgi:hypothetical protein